MEIPQKMYFQETFDINYYYYCYRTFIHKFRLKKLIKVSQK